MSIDSVNVCEGICIADFSALAIICVGERGAQGKIWSSNGWLCSLAASARLGLAEGGFKIHSSSARSIVISDSCSRCVWLKKKGV